MSVTLRSTTRRLAVFVLPHSLCEAADHCGCTRRRDGVMLPASLTIPALARVAGLPDAVLAVPAIALAVRDGSLRVERTPVAATLPEVLPEGGPEGAPTHPVEVPDERRAPLVQSRRR